MIERAATSIEDLRLLSLVWKFTHVTVYGIYRTPKTRDSLLAAHSLLRTLHSNT